MTPRIPIAFPPLRQHFLRRGLTKNWESDTPIQPVILGDRLVLCKLEGENPSGSHKDRAARWLIECLCGENKLPPGARLLVSSSGNFARAVAHYTQDLGVELVVVTDVLSPPALIERLQEYRHTQVEVIDDPDETGSHLHARLKFIQQLRTQNGELVYLNQYSNHRIPEGYERSLGPEIIRQTHGQLGALFVPVGTGGTLHGLLDYRRKTGGQWQVFAVDAEGSALFRPPIHGAVRRLSGYGNGRPTPLLLDVSDDIEYVAYVRDAEAIERCRWLAEHTGLSVGPSSGAVLAAIGKVMARRPDLLPTGPIVALLSDRGESYAEVLRPVLATAVKATE